MKPAQVVAYVKDNQKYHHHLTTSETAKGADPRELIYQENIYAA